MKNECNNQNSLHQVRQVIDFKRRICKAGESFAVINQKGIDSVALDMLAKVLREN